LRDRYFDSTDISQACLANALQNALQINRLFPIVASNVAFNNHQRAVIDDFTDFCESRR